MQTDTEHGGTDLGRRILEHRHHAGLSREDAAERAGMAPAYLGYLETSPAPNPSASALARLAQALGTDASELAGAAAAPHPLAGRPVPEPLSPAQCRGYLGTSGVGRLVFTEPRGPVAIPVNYATLGGDVIVRTSERTSLAAHSAGAHVSFEADHVDQAQAEGWSVLVSGQAHLVTSPAELETVRALDIQTWAGGEREAYLRIVVRNLTGRRIRGSRPATAGLA
jgi:hypothetical protein